MGIPKAVTLLQGCYSEPRSSPIDKGQLNRMIRFMLSQPEVKAAGATLRVANGCRIGLRGIREVRFPSNYLAGVQTVEYLRAFLVGRMGWDFFGGPPIISGAFSLYKTKVVRLMGGLDASSLGEDLELTLHYKKYQYQKNLNARTHFIPEPVAWTEVPETWGALGEQRKRWHLALFRSLYKYRKMCFNPRYGITGLFTLPYYLLVELYQFS